MIERTHSWNKDLFFPILYKVWDSILRHDQTTRSLRRVIKTYSKSTTDIGEVVSNIANFGLE
jgi:hypothetical protein